jgi:hypothetical protein
MPSKDNATTTEVESTMVSSNADRINTTTKLNDAKVTTANLTTTATTSDTHVLKNDSNITTATNNVNDVKQINVTTTKDANNINFDTIMNNATSLNNTTDTTNDANVDLKKKNTTTETNDDTGLKITTDTTNDANNLKFLSTPNDWDKIANNILGSFQVDFTANHLQVYLTGKITAEDVDYKLRRGQLIVRFYMASAEVGKTISGRDVELNRGTYTKEQWKQMISSRFIEK